MRSLEEIEQAIQTIEAEIPELEGIVRDLKEQLWNAEDELDRAQGRLADARQEIMRFAEKERADLAWWNEQTALLMGATS
jgi:septal ring factor EnvC (AmiA/AmiB activator)